MNHGKGQSEFLSYSGTGETRKIWSEETIVA